ncbi:hypothetical protein BVC80_441g6 [Macleaya cordata]|uniref:Zinc finger protein n=1 Tax=Macleaya cordata TaxID=56857 RepID=A0A200Q473_MACCD|nr:hypothetical protein BVC80_441g6 [Macleaya cordata]
MNQRSSHHIPLFIFLDLSAIRVCCQMCEKSGHTGIECPWVYTRCRKITCNGSRKLLIQNNLIHVLDPHLSNLMKVAALGAGILSTGLKNVHGERLAAVSQLVKARGCCLFQEQPTTMENPT